METISVVKEKKIIPNQIFYIYKGMLIYNSNHIIFLNNFLFNHIAHKSKNKKEPKIFICPFKDCKKAYSLKNILLAHLRIHYGIKPFICKYCSKSFNEKGNLKTHIRIHTGERPFKCKKCQKGFKALGQLKDHLISHTGYKPFQCPHCKKFYRRKEILKNHIIIHSKETFFKNNKEKFQEMMNEVKEMKHIKHNFDDLDSNNKSKNDVNTIKFSSTFSKDKIKRNNITTFKNTFLSNNPNNENQKKEQSVKNKKILEKSKEKVKKIVGKNLSNFYRINDEFLLKDKLFEDECCNVWPNEVNNILSSTVDFSIKEENNNNFESHELNFEKELNFKKSENENIIYNPQIKTNKMCLIFYENNENYNKYEKDESSNMTNLYLNEYENKKYVDDFINNF